MTSGRLRQVDDVLDGFVSFVTRGFQLTVGTMGGIGFVVEAAVGEGTTEGLVEEQEQERDVNAFGGQAVSVTAAIALAAGRVL